MILASAMALRWTLALVATALLAFWKGGAPERLAIAGVMLAHVITTLARSAPSGDWYAPPGA